MQKPFNTEFAKNGDKIEVLENGTATGEVNFNYGFTPPYEKDPQGVNRGRDILRGEMNDILNKITAGINLVADEVDKWIALTTENLNNVTQIGRYFQAIRSNATNERNYPIDEAGYLIVFDSIDNNTTQFYKSANSNKIYVRYCNGGVWSEWDSIGLTSEFYTKSQVDTKLSQKEDILPAISWVATGTTPTFRFIAGYSKITASVTILTSNIPCDGSAITATFQLKVGTATHTNTQTIANPSITGNPAIPRVILVSNSWNIGASSSNRVINCTISLSRGSVAVSSINLTQTARQ